MAKIQSVIVLSKVDLITPQELESTVTEIKSRLGDVKIVAISNMQEGGYNELAQEIESGKTYCLLGSSGVGKSTLLNHLLGAETMATGEISESIDRGKHVTSHRELVVLDNGGMIIDNPGMREVGIADATQGLEVTFDELQVLSEDCRYKDCTHLHEEDCAILEALAAGELDQNTYDNYLKMYKEQRHFSTSQEEKKRKDRGFGKMMKQVKKARKNNKY